MVGDEGLVVVQKVLKWWCNTEWQVPPAAKVVGVGGAGGNALNGMIEAGLSGLPPA